MADIILHHYPTSTFSERVRLAMGLKGMTYRSVTIPSAMPKPDLLVLTGGYRRTPVMQIGADIYCDTQLILRKLEELHPLPSLYAGADPGMVSALIWWADRSIFSPALGVVADTIGHKIPPDFVAERKAFGFALAPQDVAPLMHRHLQQGAAHLGWLAGMLSDGRRFLMGEEPTAFDFAAYGPLWLLKNQGGRPAETRLPLAAFGEWYARVTAIGHGNPVDMSAADAIATAGAADTRATLPTGADPSGLQVGSRIIVTADDTGRDPVHGTLLGANAQELVIGTVHPRVGEIAIHFPRAGFDVVAA